MATNFLRWLIFPPVSLLAGAIVAYIGAFAASGVFGNDSLSRLIEDSIGWTAWGVATAAASYYILPKNSSKIYPAILAWAIAHPLIMLGFSVVSLGFFSFENLLLFGLTITSGVFTGIVIRESMAG